MFTEVVAAYLAGREVSAAYLVRFDFRDVTKRVWLGFGDLRAGGATWQGTGDLISIDGLEQPAGTSASTTTFTLSGIDEDIVRAAVSASDQIKGRIVRVYLQFFETTESAKRDGNIQVGALVGGPAVVYTGWMDVPTYDADGVGARSITLTAEGLMADRNRPPFGLYTDGNQKARHPGDRGLEHIAGLESYTVRWVGGG